MTPTNEKTIAEALNNLSAGLGNNSAFSAYPQLTGVFYGLQANLQNLVGIMLMAQRDEALYGKTEAAKLYALKYKQFHAVPEGVLKSLGSQQYAQTCDRPLADIVDYAVAHRGLDVDTLSFSLPEFARETHVRVDLGTHQAFISWTGHALSMNLPKFTTNTALVNGPLFHEPYPVEVQPDYLDKALYNPLYSRVVGDERREVPNPKFLLMHHYFGADEAPIDVPDGHPLLQLRHLVNASLYGSGGYGFATVDWKDYTLSFSTEREWGYHESLLLTVNVQEKKEGTPFDRNRGRSIYNWWKNPLLVNDLLADMDSLIDEALSKHEAEVAE